MSYHSNTANTTAAPTPEMGNKYARGGASMTAKEAQALRKSQNEQPTTTTTQRKVAKQQQVEEQGGLFASEDNRLWAFFGLMCLSTCLGIPAHVLKSNLAKGVMWGTLPSSGLEIGVWFLCNSDGSTCSDYFLNDASILKNNACSSGFTSEQRMATFASFATLGVCFAAISAGIAMFRGTAASFARHFCSFISWGCWAIALIMFWVHDQFLICGTGFDGKTYGLSFWLALCCVALGAIAWVLSVASHSYDACCKDPLLHKEMIANGDIVVANNGDDDYQEEMAASNNNNNDASNNQMNYSAPEEQFQNYVAAQDNDAAAADTRDPASVGLEPHWYFDDESGYWWSDETQMYFDAATGAYGNPTDGTWYNAETGEWSKPE